MGNRLALSNITAFGSHTQLGKPKAVWSMAARGLGSRQGRWPTGTGSVCKAKGYNSLVDSSEHSTSTTPRRNLGGKLIYD